MRRIIEEFALHVSLGFTRVGFVNDFRFSEFSFLFESCFSEIIWISTVITVVLFELNVFRNGELGAEFVG